MRVKDMTMIEEDDEEVLQDAMTDEFAKAFTGETCPKILFTTCARPKCHVNCIYPSEFYKTFTGLINFESLHCIILVFK